MFQTKTLLGVLAGMAVAGSILVAPEVVAAPTTGTAVAWGDNGWGQLGNNSTTGSSVPVAVDTSGVLSGRNVTAITAGLNYTCAVADGKASCWGYNFSGQLGNNSSTNTSVPVAVNTSGSLAGKSVTAITAGNSHTCVVADGRAYCWGDNNFGELGDNNWPIVSTVPVTVDTSGVLAGKTVSAITAGNSHTCVVADGRAYCWGWNDYGQLGDNSTTNSAVPVAVDTSGVLAGKTVTAIDAGRYHTCAVADAQAYCWGQDSSGQLGDNSTTDSAVPVAVDTSGVLGGKTVTAIDGGLWHSCAVADGRAFCWGWNSKAQLGDNSTTNSTVPVAVSTSGPLGGRTVTAITAGDFNSCAVAEGQASCWGENNLGQLGDGSTTNSSVPVAVKVSGPLAGSTVTAITADGNFHSAAVFAVPVAPVLQKQTASVKVPKKIKYRGKTVLLKKAVRTNAGQKAKSKVTVKPKKRTYAKVKTTTSGKVTIRVRGKKKLKVTLKLKAPATSHYTAYSYTKKWTVKKKRS